MRESTPYERRTAVKRQKKKIIVAQQYSIVRDGDGGGQQQQLVSGLELAYVPADRQLLICAAAFASFRKRWEGSALQSYY
eukprot:scaffold12339_cov114-Skeletonema_menzelii.AAC.3